MRKLTYLLFISLLVISLTGWKFIQEDFIFRKGTQKLTLELSSGNRHLKWDEQTTLKLIPENIDPKTLRCFSASGLQLVKGANDMNTESSWEVTPQKTRVKNDTFELTVTGQDLNDSIWKHVFKIPVK